MRFSVVWCSLFSSPGRVENLPSISDTFLSLLAKINYLKFDVIFLGHFKLF